MRFYVLFILLGAAFSSALLAYSNSSSRSQTNEVALRHQSEAWDNFSALMSNASAIRRGNPAQPVSFANNKESVWETWKQHYEIYLDNGEQPASWYETQLMPTACQTESNSDYPFRGRKVLDSIYQAVKNNATLPSILTDQSSNTVRYEIRLNKIAFDYIVDNNLYNGLNQSEVGHVNFPLGSTLIKAAWSEVTEQDDTTKFVTRQSCICEPTSSDALNNRQCRQSNVKLIGFHITKKTQDAPQWLWSTFEHVANTNSVGNISPTLSKARLFYAGFSNSSLQASSSNREKLILLNNLKKVDYQFENIGNQSILNIKNQSYKNRYLYIYSQLNTDITDVALFLPLSKTWASEFWKFTNIGRVDDNGSTFYVYKSQWIGHANGKFRIRFNQYDQSQNAQTPQGTPTNIARVLPITTEIAKLNQQKQTNFRRLGSALSYYQLMSVQWPSQKQESALHKTVFTANPEFSANTTMESFTQKTSSCIGCHVMTRTLKPDEFVSSDFTFTLNNAKPHPTDAICDKYVNSESMSCSKKIIDFGLHINAATETIHWQSIKRGYNIANNTYELLPDNVGNKLHCSSCHLHAGGDPNSAWWVQAKERYANKVGGINARINQCFRRSMDGRNLCDSDKSCRKNTDMQALLDYMQWLTDYYDENLSQQTQEEVAAGFTGLENYPVGNIKEGSKIYNQKCAFCHNSNGQGRYESDTYFRPALWGNDSYNNSSGMNKVYKLAGFIHANMPYGSGGMLTNQEAKDLACFINRHSRPQASFDANSSIDERNYCR